MKTETQFTKASIGCHADGSFGHGHVREVLASLVSRFGEEDLAEELRGDMSDDASEEDAALDVLNEHCAPGVSFGFRDGDLILLTDEEWSEQ